MSPLNQNVLKQQFAQHLDKKILTRNVDIKIYTTTTYAIFYLPMHPFPVSYTQLTRKPAQVLSRDPGTGGKEHENV
jgi:hypothetical protein